MNKRRWLTLATLLDVRERSGRVESIPESPLPPASHPFAGAWTLIARHSAALVTAHRRAGYCLLSLIPLGVLGLVIQLAIEIARPGWRGIPRSVLEELADVQVALALAIASIPLAVFWGYERLRRTPSLRSRWLVASGRWVSVLLHACCLSVLLTSGVLMWVAMALPHSDLGGYRLNAGQLVPGPFLRGSARLVLVSIFVVVTVVTTLVIRLRRSWKAAVRAMAASAVGAALLVVGLAVAMTAMEQTEMDTLVSVVAASVLIAYFAMGPLIRSLAASAAPDATAPTSSSRTTGKSVLAGVELKSQISFVVLLLAGDIILSHSEITRVVVRAREAFAVQRAVEFLREALPTNPDCEALIGRDVWLPEPRPWLRERDLDGWRAVAGEPERDWPEPQRFRGFANRTKLLSDSSWRALRTSNGISSNRWMRISTMWVTAPSTGSSFIGNPSSRRLFVTTLYGLKVEVGTEDDQKNPEWVHVVRQRHERGDLEEVRRLLRVADPNGQPEVWMITKTNSPEYDFGRWLQVQLKTDWANRLRGLALAQGIDVKKDETSFDEILNKTERLLINRSYSVPTIGLNLAPFRAIVVLGLILLYLLLSIRSAVRQALGNREAETGDLWLPLNAESRGEWLAAAAWAIVIVVTPWILAVGLVHMTLRQFVVDGSLPALRIVLVSGASLAYAVCTSWIALTMLSMVASLRLERRARVPSAIGE